MIGSKLVLKVLFGFGLLWPVLDGSCSSWPNLRILLGLLLDSYCRFFMVL